MDDLRRVWLGELVAAMGDGACEGRKGDGACEGKGDGRFEGAGVGTNEAYGEGLCEGVVEVGAVGAKLCTYGVPL